MQYRREIDGLRAVAVMPVILFHAGFTIFSGGFVGVDVFFVISGYLITSIIIAELEQGRFSLLRFYERRARRILPALVFVILCCLPFAWMWMLPSQMHEFSHSLIAVTLFASNILFWMESDYFASASEEKPLLHTWSLAVEEQYYMLFPIFLILFWRFGRQPVFYGIIIISALSLLLSEYRWRHDPTANFYLAPTRAWELLAGSICAFLIGRNAQKSSNILSAAGLALILYSVFYFDSNTPFPSVYALAPVLGTALIILYGSRGTLVAKLLSLKGFVGIGLISYSAYLWHQPLFAFARLRSVYAPQQWQMLMLAASALVLAYLSWRFVERPFRDRKAPVLRSSGAVFGAAGVFGAAIFTVGFFGHHYGGWAERFPQMAQIEAANHVEWRDTSLCHIGDPVSEQKIQNCLKAGSSADAILLGDSHAASISRYLRSEMNSADLNLISFTTNGCFPIPRTSRLPLKTHLDCRNFKQDAFDYIDQNPGIPVIVFTRWALNINGTRFNNAEGGLEKGTAGKNVVLDKNGQFDTNPGLLPTVREQLEMLSKNRPVVVLTQFPEAGWNVARMVEVATKKGQPIQELSTALSVYKDRNLHIDEMLNSLKSPQVSVVNLQEQFCDTFIINRCVNVFDGVSFYRDDDHPSSVAATLIAQRAFEAVRETSRHPTFAQKQNSGGGHAVPSK